MTRKASHRIRLNRAHSGIEGLHRITDFEGGGGIKLKQEARSGPELYYSLSRLRGG